MDDILKKLKDEFYTKERIEREKYKREIQKIAKN